MQILSLSHFIGAFLPPSDVHSNSQMIYGDSRIYFDHICITLPLDSYWANLLKGKVLKYAHYFIDGGYSIITPPPTPSTTTINTGRLLIRRHFNDYYAKIINKSHSAINLNKTAVIVGECDYVREVWWGLKCALNWWVLHVPKMTGPTPDTKKSRWPTVWPGFSISSPLCGSLEKILDDIFFNEHPPATVSRKRLPPTEVNLAQSTIPAPHRCEGGAKSFDKLWMSLVWQILNFYNKTWGNKINMFL